MWGGVGGSGGGGAGGGVGGAHPVILVTTRSGEVMRVEPSAATPDLQLALPRLPPPRPPPPPRLLHSSAGPATGSDGRDVEVVCVGMEPTCCGGGGGGGGGSALAGRGAGLGGMLSPLELAFAERHPPLDGGGGGRGGGGEAASAADAVSELAEPPVPAPLRLTFTHRLCSAPLSLAPLGEDPGAAVVVLGRDLHSYTFRLDVSALCGTGGGFRGSSGVV
jgi:hypothetical protein